MTLFNHFFTTTKRRRISTLSSFSLRHRVKTSGRNLNCYRPLPSLPAAGRPCQVSSPPRRISWRWWPSSWATMWSTRASFATLTIPRPSLSLSSSRTACGAASPPRPSWRRWSPSGSLPSTPPGKSRRPLKPRCTPVHPPGGWIAATCKTWTHPRRSALIHQWFSHIRLLKHRNRRLWHRLVRIWGWTHHPTAAAAAAVVVTQVIYEYLLKQTHPSVHLGISFCWACK